MTEETNRLQLSGSIRVAGRAWHRYFVAFNAPFFVVSLIAYLPAELQRHLHSGVLSGLVALVTLPCIVFAEGVAEVLTAARYFQSRAGGEPKEITLREALARPGLLRTLLRLMGRTLMWLLAALAVGFLVLVCWFVAKAVLHLPSLQHGWGTFWWVQAVFAAWWAFYARYMFALPLVALRAADRLDPVGESVRRTAPFRWLAVSLMMSQQALGYLPTAYLAKCVKVFYADSHSMRLAAAVLGILAGTFVSSWFILLRSELLVRSDLNLSPGAAPPPPPWG